MLSNRVIYLIVVLFLVGMVAGRTDNNWLVQVKGSEELLGRTVAVKITEAGRLYGYGEVIA